MAALSLCAAVQALHAKPGDAALDAVLAACGPSSRAGDLRRVAWLARCQSAPLSAARWQLWFEQELSQYTGHRQWLDALAAASLASLPSWSVAAAWLAVATAGVDRAAAARATRHTHLALLQSIGSECGGEAAPLWSAAIDAEKAHLQALVRRVRVLRGEADDDDDDDEEAGGVGAAASGGDDDGDGDEEADAAAEAALTAAIVSSAAYLRRLYAWRLSTPAPTASSASTDAVLADMLQWETTSDAAALAAEDGGRGGGSGGTSVVPPLQPEHLEAIAKAVGAGKQRWAEAHEPFETAIGEALAAHAAALNPASGAAASGAATDADASAPTGPAASVGALAALAGAWGAYLQLQRELAASTASTGSGGGGGDHKVGKHGKGAGAAAASAAAASPLAPIAAHAEQAAQLALLRLHARAVADVSDAAARTQDALAAADAASATAGGDSSASSEHSRIAGMVRSVCEQFVAAAEAAWPVFAKACTAAAAAAATSAPRNAAVDARLSAIDRRLVTAAASRSDVSALERAWAAPTPHVPVQALLVAQALIDSGEVPAGSDAGVLACVPLLQCWLDVHRLAVRHAPASPQLWRALLHATERVHRFLQSLQRAGGGGGDATPTAFPNALQALQAFVAPATDMTWLQAEAEALAASGAGASAPVGDGGSGDAGGSLLPTATLADALGSSSSASSAAVVISPLAFTVYGWNALLQAVGDRALPLLQSALKKAGASKADLAAAAAAGGSGAIAAAGLPWLQELPFDAVSALATPSTPPAARRLLGMLCDVVGAAERALATPLEPAVQQLPEPAGDGDDDGVGTAASKAAADAAAARGVYVSLLQYCNEVARRVLVEALAYAESAGPSSSAGSPAGMDADASASGSDVAVGPAMPPKMQTAAASAAAEAASTVVTPAATAASAQPGSPGATIALICRAWWRRSLSALRAYYPGGECSAGIASLQAFIARAEADIAAANTTTRTSTTVSVASDLPFLASDVHCDELLLYAGTDVDDAEPAARVNAATAPPGAAPPAGGKRGAPAVIATSGPVDLGVVILAPIVADAAVAAHELRPYAASASHASASLGSLSPALQMLRNRSPCGPLGGKALPLLGLRVPRAAFAACLNCAIDVARTTARSSVAVSGGGGGVNSRIERCRALFAQLVHRLCTSRLIAASPDAGGDADIGAGIDAVPTTGGSTPYDFVGPVCDAWEAFEAAAGTYDSWVDTVAKCSVRRADIAHKLAVAAQRQAQHVQVRAQLADRAAGRRDAGAGGKDGGKPSRGEAAVSGGNDRRDRDAGSRTDSSVAGQKRKRPADAPPSVADASTGRGHAAGQPAASRAAHETDAVTGDAAAASGVGGLLASLAASAPTSAGQPAAKRPRHEAGGEGAAADGGEGERDAYNPYLSSTSDGVRRDRRGKLASLAPQAAAAAAATAPAASSISAAAQTSPDANSSADADGESAANAPGGGSGFDGIAFRRRRPGQGFAEIPPPPPRAATATEPSAFSADRRHGSGHADRGRGRGAGYGDRRPVRGGLGWQDRDHASADGGAGTGDRSGSAGVPGPPFIAASRDGEHVAAFSSGSSVSAAGAPAPAAPSAAPDAPADDPIEPRTLFVSNLPRIAGFSKPELIRLFRPCGWVEDARVVLGPAERVLHGQAPAGGSSDAAAGSGGGGKVCKGFGWVRFQTEAGMRKATDAVAAAAAAARAPDGHDGSGAGGGDASGAAAAAAPFVVGGRLVRVAPARRSQVYPQWLTLPGTKAKSDHHADSAQASASGAEAAPATADVDGADHDVPMARSTPAAPAAPAVAASTSAPAAATPAAPQAAVVEAAAAPAAAATSDASAAPAAAAAPAVPAAPPKPTVSIASFRPRAAAVKKPAAAVAAAPAPA